MGEEVALEWYNFSLNSRTLMLSGYWKRTKFPSKFCRSCLATKEQSTIRMYVNQHNESATRSRRNIRDSTHCDSTAIKILLPLLNVLPLRLGLELSKFMLNSRIRSCRRFPEEIIPRLPNFSPRRLISPLQDARHRAPFSFLFFFSPPPLRRA